MARPQVADGGEGLQIWRVAANTLHKQSRTADKGCSNLGFRRGFNSLSYKTSTLRNVTCGIGWILVNTDQLADCQFLQKDSAP
jgi:hypothetical protein